MRWRPGDSPKEHREYRERQKFQDLQTKREEQQRQFQAEQRREDLQWREKQEQKAEEHYREQLREARRMHNRELLYLGLGVTIAILLITVIGSGIEAGWIPKWFGLAN
jgi:hypothetical protein